MFTGQVFPQIVPVCAG